jgi:hypothetical protein
MKRWYLKETNAEWIITAGCRFTTTKRRTVTNIPKKGAKWMNRERSFRQSSRNNLLFGATGPRVQDSDARCFFLHPSETLMKMAA